MSRRVRARAGALATTALTAGIALAAVSVPQLAVAAGLPPVPGSKNYPYTKSKACVGDVGVAVPRTVANGVSAAQRTLQFTRAWQFSKGRGVKVGIIDTGVNPGPAFGSRLHPLADLVQPGKPGKNGPGLQDCDGHGTLVAGIIAASSDPKSGFSGVAPEAELYSIRQTSSNYSYKDKNGTEHLAGEADGLGDAIEYAVQYGRVSVINISLTQCDATGNVDTSQRLIQAVQYAVSHDVVVVAAAGNVDSNTHCSPQNTPGKAQVTAATPADLPGVLAVGALDTDGNPADFSLVGTDVGVAAPGTDIVSTNPYPGATGQVNTIITQNGRGSIQGTSFAAPYVTGIAALIRGAHPSWSAKDVIAAIEQSAAHPAAPGGQNDYVGHGLVDPVAAVTALQPSRSSSLVKSAPGPAALPAERVSHTSSRPRHVALYGSLVVGLLILALAVFGQTARTRRRRNHARLAGSSGRRELTGAR